ncbi:MAG: uridine kinase [Actinobacteria bacterium]|nr:uridine kinase [Actinomycetota bacterium]
MSVVCGICGGSGAGKSTLAGAVVEILEGSGVGVVVLPFDDYYRDHGHLGIAERALVNYDHPDSLDLAQFAADLGDLARGRPVDVPVYDFATHRRHPGTRRLSPQPVVLTEGILLLATPEVRRLLDVAVFVEAPEDIRRERRVIRDVGERGRTPESVRSQFAATVAPMYGRFVEPFAGGADRTVDGTGDLARQAADLADLLVDRLEGASS